jgi:hypothetical protein
MKKTRMEKQQSAVSGQPIRRTCLRVLSSKKIECGAIKKGYGSFENIVLHF